MQSSSMNPGSNLGTTDDPAPKGAEEPQLRDRARSGILGEPASTPADGEASSDGSERVDPLDEQVPHDGKDHWRR